MMWMPHPATLAVGASTATIISAFVVTSSEAFSPLPTASSPCVWTKPTTDFFLKGNRHASLSYGQRHGTAARVSSTSKHQNDDADKSSPVQQQPKQQSHRSMSNLQTWALERGIQFSKFAELYQEEDENWGVRLTEDAIQQPREEEEEEASPIELLSIPFSLLLTSEQPLFETIAWASSNAPSPLEYARHEWERQDAQFHRFWPELVLLLNLVVLQRLPSGSSNDQAPELDHHIWRPWLDSLPNHFDTGLYWGERSTPHDSNNDSHSSTLVLDYALQFPCLRRFWQYQHDQYGVMSTTAKDVLYAIGLLSKDESDADVESLLQWAYSTVFSRSWRYFVPAHSHADADKEQHAMIVPMADMFNHCSKSAYSNQNSGGDAGSCNDHVNMVRVQLPDNSIDDDKTKGPVKVVWTPNKANSLPSRRLYLNYGFVEHPARFLVVFGFLDQSTSVVSANITWDRFFQMNSNVNDEMIRAMGLDQSSQLVFDTSDGSVSDLVWDAMLFQVLLEQRHETVRNKTVTKPMAHDEELLEDWQVFYKAKSILLAQTPTDPPAPLVVEQQTAAAEADEMILRLHIKWELEVALTLQRHVETLLEIYRGVSLASSSQRRQPPVAEPNQAVVQRLSMLQQYQSFMVQVLQRVLAQAKVSVAEAQSRQHR